MQTLHKKNEEKRSYLKNDISLNYIKDGAQRKKFKLPLKNYKIFEKGWDILSGMSLCNNIS
jgi:hypothetical protein